MGYEVKKRYVRKDGSVCWRVVLVEWKGSERIQSSVKTAQYPSLGFKLEMSFEEAKAWQRQLNAGNFELALEKRKLASSERRTDLDKAILIYLPEVFVALFESEINKRFSGQLDPHWLAAKKLIADIKLPSHEWWRQPEILYNYFKENTYSLSYTEKVLRALNEWGKFMAYKTNKPYFPVPMPKGRAREKISDAYFESEKPTKESVPITPDELAAAKDKLSLKQFNYIFVCIWLGLRPVELDKTTLGDKAWKVEIHEGMEVLAIYQSKLTGIAREKRWKYIPLLFAEQKEAIKIIRTGEFERPLPKTVRKHVKSGANNYGGRKGFEALMRSKGRTFTEAQAWLGHSSIERTWRDYRDKLKVFIEKKKD